MYKLLEGYLVVAAKSGLRQQLIAILRDPFKKSSTGGFKLSPLWIGLGTLAALVVSVFLYFNFSKF